jgi:DNA-binding transcriptional LysR family regulator
MIFKIFGNIMDNLGDIRLFVEAANQGGLSAAGRKLGLSPAAASARLIKLESVLHTRLFERTTRHLRLTDEGRSYLAYCQQALQALDDGHAFLQAGKSVVSGKVRISATSDFGRNVLKDWLDQFNQQYPEVTFALLLSDSLSNLLQDDVDLIIRFGVPADSSFIARPLAPNRRVLCASLRYIAKHGTPENPRDLERFDCIVLGSAAGPANEWRFTRNGKVESYTVPLAEARETNDGALAREWAIRGYGIAMKSMWDIGADLGAGRLKILLPQWRSADAPVHALYQRNRYMPRRVSVLLDFLVKRFAEESSKLLDNADSG